MYVRIASLDAVAKAILPIEGNNRTENRIMNVTWGCYPSRRLEQIHGSIPSPTRNAREMNAFGVIAVKTKLGANVITLRNQKVTIHRDAVLFVCTIA